MLPPEMKSVIFLLVKKLSGIGWALIASANLALQGIGITPNDIGIMTTEKHLFEIPKIRGDYLVKSPFFKESDKIRSYFSIYKINNVK